MPDYPGLGLPLRYDRQKLSNQSSHYPIAAHDGCWGAISKLIYVRELAMMSIMDGLTDKEDWHTKVFNEEIVSKWRAEALAIPDEQFWMIAIRDKQQTRNNHGKISTNHDNIDRRLEGIMNASTFDCCIEELRSKAKYYERTGVIPTLDACASVAKSDHLVSADLHNSLCEAFDTLKSDQSSSLDWHPNSDDMVQDLVHPSMYPLVHGRSRIMKDEAVGVNDAIEKWAGKGEIIPLGAEIHRGTRNTTWGYQGSDSGRYHYWSNKYQWLPANMAFQEDGTVKFTSYINNIHPTRYPEIYRTIEKLVETTLPLWDQCLALNIDYNTKHGAGRLHPRFPYPEDPDDENTEHWNPSGPEPVFGQKKSSLKTSDKDEIDIEGTDNEMEEEEEEEDAEEEWKEIRKPVIPEPFFQDIDYSIKLRLAHQFHESGLQIIIKMASIELTPEKPEFPAGSWHIEGQMNEHIAGTALYYLDSENITSSDLSFRMQTREDINNDLETGQDSYSWLEQVFGTNLGQGNSPCLQNYGSVETRQGRLLAFPNVFQHKVSSFRLEDPTKPGHRRFIALWLVDPTLRVISTANVPPQQLDWWADSVFGNTPEARRAAMSKLPAELVMLLKESGLNTDTSTKDMKFSPELMEMVREYFNDNDNPLLMGIEEAKEHRLKLMEERGAFVTTTGEAWHNTGYNFCEH
ncbi:hypothetical protein BCIN_09g06840 [Botrytis cinerea B05.10]|uniref:Duf1665 domain containing protein n=1 Tax=Botryotinia fuckeliana (strain B05.10) TaxID=332648 RepID=A0A384JTT7_BOTFB|nr:hypothetical protein BCIN_09g06840 [Botrytis cinerea B05.10]ATZ53930.1 hypothetical protein BCIN_09g06840 [Botrytis cinerea B05.10]